MRFRENFWIGFVYGKRSDAQRMDRGGVTQAMGHRDRESEHSKPHCAWTKRTIPLRESKSLQSRPKDLLRDGSGGIVAWGGAICKTVSAYFPVVQIKTPAAGVKGSDIHPSLITQLPVFPVFYPKYYQKSIEKLFEQPLTVKSSAVLFLPIPPHAKIASPLTECDFASSP